MGQKTEIIVAEKIEECPANNFGSKITMHRFKGRGFPDKQVKTIARTLVERLLPYFIDSEYRCPEIGISEQDGTGRIILNDFVNNQLSAMIMEIDLQSNEFTIGSGEKSHTFTVRLFKIFSPRNQKSKISLVADRREVTDTAIHHYVPYLNDELFD